MKATGMVKNDLCSIESEPEPTRPRPRRARDTRSRGAARLGAR